MLFVIIWFILFLLFRFLVNYVIVDIFLLNVLEINFVDFLLEKCLFFLRKVEKGLLILLKREGIFVIIIFLC